MTVNQTTGHVVDGHLRIELALARKEPTVPVTYVELSEDEERLVLASLDPLATMAEAEAAKLAELLEGLDPADAALRALLDDLARENDRPADHPRGRGPRSICSGHGPRRPAVGIHLGERGPSRIPRGQLGRTGACHPARLARWRPGGVTGTITSGPVCPIEQSPPDPKCAPRPVAGAVVIAKDATGDEVGRTTSLADGSYRLPMGRTGRFVITALPVNGLARPPAPVSVSFADLFEWQQLDLEYDTGIR